MLPDRGPTVFIVALVTLVLATAMTILRLVSKWGIVKNRRDPDDYLTLLAWVSRRHLLRGVTDSTAFVSRSLRFHHGGHPARTRHARRPHPG